MNLFKDEAGLARLLGKKPELYNQVNSALEGLTGQEILEDRIEKGLADTKKTLESANATARNSDYFVFSVYDSWGQEQYGQGFGYSVFQKINDKMVQRLGIAELSPTFREVVNFLKKNNVERIFTAEIPFLDGYFGIQHENRSGERNEDVITYSKVDGEVMDQFKKYGIELVVLR